ncbi:MAG TPA: tRNA-binding protein [Candidatus Thermoplasmatota archaeon]|nr:tRNA-binding protein [Candidatus Thermoplasmatota archaeon]
MPIEVADFQKIDIRVGRVLEARVSEKARKPSYALRIDFGPLGVKTSSAAVRPWYKPEELVGRQVVAVVNFPPRNVAGVESEVLVLGAVEQDGRVVLLQPDAEATLGSRIA